MALTTQEEEGKLDLWNRKVIVDYNRTNLFGPYIGGGTESIIQIDSQPTEGGKSLRIGLVYDLDTTHVGENTLEGRETQMDFAFHTARPVWVRKAVSFKKSENHKSVFDLLDTARGQIVGFRRNSLRNRIIDALGAVATDEAYMDEGAGVGAQIPFWDSKATSTILNTYVTNNSSRLLFGNQESNLTSGDWASSLANVDATNDKFGYNTIMLAREIAQASNPGVSQAVRPVQMKNGMDLFVMFITPTQRAQALQDTQIRDFYKDARPRSTDNPFFNAGDIMVENVILKTIPEMGRNSGAETYLANKGASSAPLTAGFMCGAQAIVQAIGQPFRALPPEKKDYQFITGIGTEALDAVEKLFFRGQQYGVVNVFTAK